MKLRRAMAVAAATAVIAPAAFLTAPAAFAEGTPSSAESSTPATGESTTPSTAPADETDPAAITNPSTAASTPATAPSAPANTPGSPAASQSTPVTEPDEDEENNDDEDELLECSSSDLELSITGLPGKIAAGSGWHKFKLNVLNTSKSPIKDIDYVAGAAADKDGANIFTSKQVELQSLDPVTKTWETLDEEGHAVGYVASSDELKPGHEVNLPLRVNVKASAPVGAGFTLGGGLYIGDKDCFGFKDVAYKFRIVKAGTDTGGTKPQEGGKVPVPSEKPAAGTTAEVSGSLAETGAGSMLPTVGVAGGVAVLAGAGVVFAMKRRRGDATA